MPHGSMEVLSIRPYAPRRLAADDSRIRLSCLEVLQMVFERSKGFRDVIVSRFMATAAAGKAGRGGRCFHTRPLCPAPCPTPGCPTSFGWW